GRVADRLASGHGPDPRRKVFAGRLHFEVDASTANGRLDLGTRAHNTLISQKSLDIRRTEPRDNLGVESLEGLAKRRSFSQDRQPRQAGLKAVEHQFLPERPAITLRHPPFFIVILAE